MAKISEHGKESELILTLYPDQTVSFAINDSDSSLMATGSGEWELQELIRIEITSPPNHANFVP